MNKQLSINDTYYKEYTMIRFNYQNTSRFAMELQDRTVVNMIQPDVNKWLSGSNPSEQMQALDLLAEKLANVPPVGFAIKNRRQNRRHKHNHYNKKANTMKTVIKNNKTRSPHATDYPIVNAALNILRTSARHTGTENAFDNYLAGDATEDDVKKEVDYIVNKHSLVDYICFSTCDDIARRMMLEAFNANKYGAVFDVIASKGKRIASKTVA